MFALAQVDGGPSDSAAPAVLTRAAAMGVHLCAAKRSAAKRAAGMPCLCGEPGRQAGAGVLGRV